MKNSLHDLNKQILRQLERLSNEELSGDLLNDEIQRAETVASLADSLIDNNLCALQVLYQAIDEAQSRIDSK